MQFLRIENALTRLAGNDRFYQTASQFEQILKNQDLSPEEKAREIAEVIESGIQRNP